MQESKGRGAKVNLADVFGFCQYYCGMILLGVLPAPSPAPSPETATANATVNAPVKKKGYIRRIGEDKNGHWEVH